jgi:hypothetical protein
LSGTISIPYLGFSNVRLKGSLSGNVIVFGDVNETITFTGMITNATTASGTYVLPSLNDSGTWQVTKTGASAKPTVTLTAPVGGETWSGTQNITWITNGDNPGTVVILLSSDSGATYPTSIATAAPDNGSYSWDTATIPNGSHYRVRIVPTDAARNVGLPAVSSADFSINNATTTVTLTVPLGGEVWSGTQQITWTNSDGSAGTVEIRLSSDFGDTYPTVIAAAAPDTGAVHGRRLIRTSSMSTPVPLARISVILQSIL